MILGVIGSNSNQCKRLLAGISESRKKRIQLLLFKHREGLEIEEIHKDFLNASFVSNLEEMLCCDGIIISSPNSTHYSYLSFFITNDYKGYVLCEKPPVETYEEVEALEKIADFYKERILFGFNLRFSKLCDCFQGTTGESLGRLLYCNIVNGHGLAYKSEYKDSWRNDKQKNALGVYETVMIHYIDLFLYTVGAPQYDYVSINTLASGGQVPDNCTYEAHKDSSTAHFFVSYTMPYKNTADFIFENGIITVDDSKIELRGPRETFDNNGCFTVPPVIKTIPFEKELWGDSYKNMVEYFIDIINNGRTIPIEQFSKSLNTNRYILKHDIDKKFLNCDNIFEKGKYRVN